MKYAQSMVLASKEGKYMALEIIFWGKCINIYFLQNEFYNLTFCRISIYVALFTYWGCKLHIK